MQIERLQIEGGFLNGFDLRFRPGLNVIIGARGTGKTSVIELLRFVLGARNHTSESQSRSLEHAHSILDGGEVTVLIDNIFDEVTASRNANDEVPRSSGPFTPPIVLSQTEIETLGLSDSGRLNLIDAFVQDRSGLAAEEAAAVSALRSIYKELSGLESEIAELSQNMPQRDALVTERSELESQQLKFRSQADDVKQRQDRLAELTAEIAKLSVSEGSLSRFQQSTNKWADNLKRMLQADLGPESSGTPESLKELQAQYQQAVRKVGDAIDAFVVVSRNAQEQLSAIQSAKFSREALARPIRVELDQLTQGAGAIEKQLTHVQTKIAELDAKEKIVAERRQRLAASRKHRDERFTQLQKIRARRSELRTQAAATLSRALSPNIKVEIERLAKHDEYANAITDALRGSGMKYNDLAVAVAENVSQRELIDFAEANDFSNLADIVGIPKDRAARMLSHLNEHGIGEIVSVNIDDNVRLSLLDGLEFKQIDALSAGQRCTVILSIVLQLRDRILIIDQPEDHLDNAFIATTVIKSLLERKKDGQVILSTHNANIPVLGEADLVVELTSDGRNGFVQLAEELDHPGVVQAISAVMEGGNEAFRARAAFYAAHTK